MKRKFSNIWRTSTEKWTTMKITIMFKRSNCSSGSLFRKRRNANVSSSNHCTTPSRHENPENPSLSSLSTTLEIRILKCTAATRTTKANVFYAIPNIDSWSVTTLKATQTKRCIHHASPPLNSKSSNRVPSHPNAFSVTTLR